MAKVAALTMNLLDNVIQPYAWGSRDAIARLQGRPSPTERPEAELWMGAHPSAPSKLRGTAGTLLQAVTEAPEQLLGEACVARFGPRLPFLLKVLAAGTPLSLQAHPSLAQAQEGFRRENEEGVPLEAPHRKYRDPNHKPELMCALEPFWALYGFRDVAQTVALLESLEVPQLSPLVWILRRGEEGLRQAFETLMTLPPHTREPLVNAVLTACARATKGPFSEEKRWALRLGELYPGDAGVVGALLLNLVRLEPGEALYLPAGNLHAYLQGTGVELMASSDNVLRGGCTPKYVDVAELCRVLEFRAIPPRPVRPERVSDVEQVYRTAAPDFRLSRLELGTGTGTGTDSASSTAFESPGGMPQIILCVEGDLRLTASASPTSLALSKGQSAFIAAADGAWRAEGSGVAFRATVGDL